MARIQLRDTTVYLQDGLSGTADINDASPADLTGEVTLDVNGATVVLNTDVTDLIPIGARFTAAGETGLPIHTVTARTPSGAGPTTNIVFTPALASDITSTATLTFLPHQIKIRVGDGDLSWTEGRQGV